MTVALFSCLVALVALLGLRRSARPTHVARLSEEEGNSLDRALCSLIKDVASAPPPRHHHHH